MSDHDFARRYRLMQSYVGWCDDDARRVALLGPLIAPHAVSLIEDFYAEIQRHTEAAQVITGGVEQIERLSRTLREWLAQLLGGRYDEAYMAQRWKVGYRHVEIGLAQRFTSLALSRLRTGIVRRVCSEWRGSTADLTASLESLHKLLDLDLALIQDAYEYEHIRREMLFERQRGERKFRYLVDSASCLIAILSPGHAVVYFNPCAEQTTGYRADELRQQEGRVLSLLGRNPHDSVQRLNAVLAGAETVAYEDQIAGREGPPRWINWTLSRIDDFDEGPAVLAVGHDVTQQKLAAGQLLQASRLATIGEMYARLAHESRNSLQRLRIYTELLADQVADRPSAAVLVERSERAQGELQRLLDEVRNFASPLALELTDCRLSALWREAWSLLQVQRQGRRAELVDGECVLPLEVQADRFRMVQVFRNIFENALAACGDPVAICLRCRETTVDGQAGVEILVEDNGPGFDAEAVHRAFEPFFTTKSTGTGLGLAIAQRIIEAHGGRVSASRGTQGGALICLALPRRSET